MNRDLRQEVSNYGYSRLGIVDPLALSAEIDFRLESVTLDP